MFRKAVRAHVLKKKEDSLGALLHETIQKQREEIRNAMMRFPYFQSWPQDKIHQCCVHSNIINYGENDIVRVKDDANVYVTHFILDGEVTVIQRITVSKYKAKDNPKKYYYKLSKRKENEIKSKNSNFEPIYMQICHLSKGATFGLGEDLCKDIIIASKPTKCLLVPRHIILQHYSLDNVWQKMILYLNTVYPSEEEVFEQFILGRKWKEYSKSLYNLASQKSKLTNICIHDVPITCRINDVALAKFFKKAQKDPLYLVGERNVSVPFIDAFQSNEPCISST